MQFSPQWKRLLILLLAIGVVFRFVNLNHKVYWHDEVYTSLRAAGHTRQAIDASLFQNRLVSIPELQQFQQMKPGSQAIDTVRSLAVEDPQHPPLYFLLARTWMHWFGSVPLAAPRSLPAGLSLLAIPAMYALGAELFASPAVGLLAATFIALSPFDVLFAQVARQYSLLTVMVIVSYWLLLRAMRRTGEPTPRQDWLGYSLAVAIGLYTHPFFGLAIIAQACYVGLQVMKSWTKPPVASTQILVGFGVALLVALALYAPWLGILYTNLQRTIDTTDWTRDAPGIAYLLKLWLLSFTSLFLDLDFGFNQPLTFLLRLPIVLLLGLALCQLRHNRSAWLCLVVMSLVPFLLLALPDLAFGGKRSAISRYLIPCYPGVQLAIAGFLAPYLCQRAAARTGAPIELAPRWGRSVFAGLVLSSLVSLTVSAAAFTWWHNDPSHFNGKIAAAINRVSQPILISDSGDDRTNMGDLISLSYLLEPRTRLLLLRSADWVNTTSFEAQIRGDRVFVFRPSAALFQTLEQRYGALERVIIEDRLWKMP